MRYSENENGSVTNSNNGSEYKENDSLRSKELDREAERERERQREKEIREFREFSTKLPIKQTKRSRGGPAMGLDQPLGPISDTFMPPINVNSNASKGSRFPNQQLVSHPYDPINQMAGPHGNIQIINSNLTPLNTLPLYNQDPNQQYRSSKQTPRQLVHMMPPLDNNGNNIVVQNQNLGTPMAAAPPPQMLGGSGLRSRGNNMRPQMQPIPSVNPNSNPNWDPNLQNARGILQNQRTPPQMNFPGNPANLLTSYSPRVGNFNASNSSNMMPNMAQANILPQIFPNSSNNPQNMMYLNNPQGINMNIYPQQHPQLVNGMNNLRLNPNVAMNQGNFYPDPSHINNQYAMYPGEEFNQHNQNNQRVNHHMAAVNQNSTQSNHSNNRNQVNILFYYKLLFNLILFYIFRSKIIITTTNLNNSFDTFSILIPSSLITNFIVFNSLLLILLF